VAKKTERRRNAVALLVLLLVVGVVAFLCLRPATVTGVDDAALAHSVGDGGSAFNPKCLEKDDGLWQCEVEISGLSGTAAFLVKTRSLGCWDAWRNAKPPVPEGEPSRSGCITVLDVAFGD
jgi:hypothetical protein